MGNEDERQLLPTRIGLKARHVIARPEGPGMVPRNFPKPCKGVPDVFQFVGEMGAAAGAALTGLGGIGWGALPGPSGRAITLRAYSPKTMGLRPANLAREGPPISRAEEEQNAVGRVTPCAPWVGRFTPRRAGGCPPTRVGRVGPSLCAASFGIQTKKAE